MTDPISVPAAVLTGLEAVRVSDRCKLLDLPNVLSWLAMHHYPQAEQWIRDHHDDYIRGVIYGFEAAS
jgi:hypothetical protein